jgi:3-oxoacyl-[acyl-carrier-protein] synthase II
MRKVVITGLGAISPLGNTVQQSWEALLAGKSGIGAITAFDASAIPARIAGEVKNFDPATTGLPPKDLKKCDRFIQLGLAATLEALSQAGMLGMAQLPTEQRQRIAVLVGTGIGGLGSIEDAIDTMAEKGPTRLSPFFIPAMLPNLLAGQISLLYGAQGANVCPVSACATSAHAIGWGKRMIEYGEADMVIAGGAEAAITRSAVAGFAAMRALSTSQNDNPTAASRPFDEARDGFVMGEGAAILILESEEHAKARGATILGYVAGFGQSADAFHLTTPAPNGEGAQRAMKQALAESGLQASDIGYVNAHATSTPAGDVEEAAAIATVLGGTGTPVSSTKGATGHLLGAAGALEAVFSMQALLTGTIPPTINLANPIPAQGITLPTQATPAPNLKAVLSNSFGFGGTNASILLAKA